MGERSPRRNSEVLTELLRLEGARTLDVGCGEGALLRWLCRRGADAYGLDPQLPVLRRAAAAAGPGRCVAARAERLPFPDRSFDIVLFFNSLHHLPETVMPAALAEAARVLRPDAPLVVVEPIAAGGYFEVMRPVEDETEVRAAARRALLEAGRSGFRLELEREYDTLVPIGSPAELLSRLAAADPGREARLEVVRPLVERLYAEHRRRDAKGRPVLDQPMRVHLLRRRWNDPGLAEEISR